MDVKSFRRQNLTLLKREYGTLAAIERATDGEVSASYLSQILGKRHMGDKVARKLEAKLKLAHGWMDRHESDVKVSNVPASHSLPHGTALVAQGRRSLRDGDGDVCTVSRLQIDPAVAVGIDRPGHDPVIDDIQISKQWVSRNLPDITSPLNLRIMTAHDDSMEPTFSDGSVLFVDVGVHEIYGDRVYVFTLDTRLFIKRLQRLPGNVIKVSSDNRAKYDPYVLEGAMLRSMAVMGPVVGWWNWYTR